MKTRKKGISLMVLVITIVVILILTAIIVISFVKSNPINNGKKAVISMDIGTTQDAYSTYISNRILDKEDVIAGCGIVSGGNSNAKTALKEDEIKYSESINNVALKDVEKVDLEKLGIKNSKVASAAIKNNKIMGIEVVNNGKSKYYMKKEDGTPKEISKESYLSLTTANPNDQSDLESAKNTIKSLQDQIEDIRKKIIEEIKKAEIDISDGANFDEIYKKLEEIISNGKDKEQALIEIANKVSGIINENVDATKEAIIAGIDKIIADKDELIKQKDELIKQREKEAEINAQTLVNMSKELTEFRKIIAKAITDNGVETNENATSKVMADNITKLAQMIKASKDEVIKQKDELISEKNSQITNLTQVITTTSNELTSFKTAIANAITNQGVQTSTNATSQVMINNISTLATNKYNAGVNDTKKGTANAAQVLSGYTFTSASGVNQSGSMPNRGNLNWNPSSSTSYTVPAGYYSGGTISTSNAYSAGVTAADNRTNTNSTNYKNGYNAGYTAGSNATKGSYVGQGGEIQIRKVQGTTLPLVLDKYSKIIIKYDAYCPHEDEDHCDMLYFYIDNKNIATIECAYDGVSDVLNGCTINRTGGSQGIITYSISSLSGSHKIDVNVYGSGSFSITIE